LALHATSPIALLIPQALTSLHHLQNRPWRGSTAEVGL